MKSWFVPALACFAHVLVAQEQSPPPDLEAIAKLPDVVAAWPPDDLRKVLEFGALFTAVERDVLLDEGTNGNALLAVAMKVVADADGQSTRRGMAREIRACLAIGN